MRDSKFAQTLSIHINNGGSGVVMVLECRIMFVVFRGVVGERVGDRCGGGDRRVPFRTDAVDVRQIVDGMQIR